MEQLGEILAFVGLSLWTVWPMFLISIILSVLIRTVKLDRLIKRAFSANIGKAIILATLVGAFSPFCSCTVVPIIAGLLLSGVPLAPVMSFWIASPTMDPEIFALSVGILGWPMALARLAATLVVSLAAGYFTLAVTKRLSSADILSRRQQRETHFAVNASSSLPPLIVLPAAPSTLVLERSPRPAVANTVCAADAESDPEIAVCVPGAGIVLTRPVETRRPNQIAAALHAVNWSEFVIEVVRESWALGRWIILAFLLEALIIQFVPQARIAGWLGNESPFAVPLATLIGIPLYLNNYSALPIVAGLLAQGMQPGAAIAFLIAGPITTIPAMTAVYGIVRRRVFALYLAISLFGAMFAGAISNMFLR